MSKLDIIIIIMLPPNHSPSPDEKFETFVSNQLFDMAFWVADFHELDISDELLEQLLEYEHKDVVAPDSDYHKLIHLLHSRAQGNYLSLMKTHPTCMNLLNKRN
jgi:hypothetical protein